MTILLVEDDTTILSGLSFCLEKENFKVLQANNGEEALNKIANNAIDLLLLDINLPDYNGLDLFNQIKHKDIPTIFLTANDFETTTVEALDKGADDYITKPFKTRELISRINSVLRRVNKTENKSTLTIKNITINLTDASVYKDNKKIDLTSLELKILHLLFININKVVTRNEIIDKIWEWTGNDVNDNTVTVYLKRIREKLDTDIIKITCGDGTSQNPYIIGI